MYALGKERGFRFGLLDCNPAAMPELRKQAVERMDEYPAMKLVEA